MHVVASPRFNSIILFSVAYSYPYLSLPIKSPRTVALVAVAAHPMNDFKHVQFIIVGFLAVTNNYDLSGGVASPNRNLAGRTSEMDAVSSFSTWGGLPAR